MGSFAKQMQAFAEKTNQRIDDVIIGFTFQLSESIILMTPVDKGRARGNWNPSIGTPDGTVGVAIDKTGSSVLSKTKSVAEKAPGNIFYFVNNLPYIRRLEYGWSVQAPQGMVRVTILNFRRALKKAINES